MKIAIKNMNCVCFNGRLYCYTGMQSIIKLVVINLALTLLMSTMTQSATAQAEDIQLDAIWFSIETDWTASIAWGDVDGDGDLDLAVGNTEWSATNYLYRNDGGTLTSSAVWSSNEADPTTSIAWGDVDDDGDLDLVVGNSSQPNRLYRNDGGTLTSSAVWSSSESDGTTSIAWADMDGDGDLDLAVGNGGRPNRLYRNDGGTLTSSAVWSSSESDGTTSIAWGDVDNDGDLDLVAGNANSQSNRLYLNENGTLSTNAVWSSSETDHTWSVAWGDVDNDGDLDLVAGNALNQPNRIYRNDGGGLTISAVWSSNEVDYTTSVAWGDVDNDGDLDLAVGNARSQPNRIYRNEGGILSATIGWSSVEAESTLSVAWGDVDGDGDLDLATGNELLLNRVYVNEGDMLTASNVWSPSDSETNIAWSVAWGDVDGDGDLDLGAGVNGGLRLYRNDGGRLTSSPIWSSVDTGSSARSIAWGDVDGDGDLDLAVGNSSKPNQIYHNENGVLTSSPIWISDEVIETESIAWGDVDGDGDLDLAVGGSRGLRLYNNEGGMLISNAVWSVNEDTGIRSIAWGDMDGDGDLDLAIGRYGPPNQVYRNDSGTLTTDGVWFAIESDVTTTSVAWGDVDGDGDLDLAVGNDENPTRLYRNNGGILTASAVWSSADINPNRTASWGDVDGDGDLDLVVGNRLYRNDGGVLTVNPVWIQSQSPLTSSVAWGDVDGDGDLDLAVGLYSGQIGRLYRNLGRSIVSLANNPPYLTISRPGNTDDAGFFSTPHVIQDANIPIPYTLFDPEADIIPKIFPEYSPNGAGQWFPATPGSGGDGLTNLAASSGGTPHTFIWQARANLIKSDNVVFRIRAQPYYTHSPILWPAVDAKSLPFRVAPLQFVKIVDESGNSVSNATVYANGQSVGITDQSGLLNPGALAAGTQLVALVQQKEEPTVRAAHSGWAYRTYLTSLTWDANGQPQPFIVSGPGEQRLVVQRTQPLVLFNLVVSIEWDADDAYLQQIERAMRRASDYVYDFTDGQMAFGQVAIYDSGEHWADADIQISAKNIVHPHAFIGGITSVDKAHVIRLGRGWDGNSGNQGAWDQPEGYRTLAHEFGHYALHLYDEYFAYVFDSNGNLLGEAPAACIGPENRNPATDAINASVMDYQYTASELSARSVPGMWSSQCEQTAQWQLNPGESAWDTWVRKYADTTNSPRWQFSTPMARGSVLAGPNQLPTVLPYWPIVQVPPSGGSSPIQLTVHNAQDPFRGAIVALYKQADSRVIDQGFTNRNGSIDIYGAVSGDIVRASSFDGGLAGSVTVGTAPTLTLALTPVRQQSAQAVGVGATAVASPPHMQVRAAASPNANLIDLFVSLSNFGAGADPILNVTVPGSEVSSSPVLSYSPGTDTYEGKLTFSATERGTGHIRAAALVDNSSVRLQSTYRLQRVVDNQVQDVFSDDGNLSLHLDANSLPNSDAYLVVMPPGAVPGALPEGLVLVGDVYDITSSGALAALEAPAVLTLRYDKVLVNRNSAPDGLGVYRWDSVSQSWQAIPSNLDEQQKAMVASVTTLGVYALLAPPWVDDSLPTDEITMRVGSAVVNPGASVTVPVEMVGALSNGLSGATVEIRYDPTLLTATDCTIDAVFDAGFCNAAYEKDGIYPDILRLNALSTSGVTAGSESRRLADITFRAAGQSGQSALLELVSGTVTDPDGLPVLVTEQDGQITIEALPAGKRGDVNCDDNVNVIDGLFILQYDVGLKRPSEPCPLASGTLYLPLCDVNTDNSCNAVDALFIMQCDVGIANVLCPNPNVAAAFATDQGPMSITAQYRLYIPFVQK